MVLTWLISAHACAVYNVLHGWDLTVFKGTMSLYFIAFAKLPVAQC